MHAALLRLRALMAAALLALVAASGCQDYRVQPLPEDAGGQADGGAGAGGPSPDAAPDVSMSR
jgi:hypothetical protein